MKAYLFILVPFLVLIVGCSTEKIKTTKVNIEIGAPSTNQKGVAEIHQSKKAYSGYQHKTKLGTSIAQSIDSNGVK
jgi:ABC-type metal ion transport system substrate-binding protein